MSSFLLLQAQPAWRDTQDAYSAYQHLSLGSGANITGQSQLMGHVQPGRANPPFPLSQDLGGAGLAHGSREGGGNSLGHSNPSGMWQPLDPSQRRGLTRGLSGESAVPEPGDWDPLYRSAKD